MFPYFPATSVLHALEKTEGSLGATRAVREWWHDRPILVKGLVVVGIPVIPLLALNLFLFAVLAQGGEPEATSELAQRSRQIRIAGIASVIGILGGIAGAVLFGTSVTRRVRDLEEDMRRLSAGEPLAPGPGGRDEIGRLATGLRRAQELLEERERALRRSEEQLALAVSGSRDGLWDWDLETDEVFFSPRWKEMLGYGDDELADSYETFRSLVHPEDLPRVEEAIRSHISGRTPEYEVEIRMRHRDGSWRWISSRGRSVRGAEGEALRMAGFHTDVTRRRRREEELREAHAAARAATQAKSAFLATMSHELRTPLNAIIGFSELLEDGTAGELNEKQAGYIENVLGSARHLLDLINDILDLSKVEAGKMQLHPEELDPLPILKNSLAIIRGASGRKGIRLGDELPAELPTLIADEARLKQAVYNLLSNAVKFTPEGGEVTLGAEPGEAEPDSGRTAEPELRIWVRDTGIGLEPENIERIFREFEQVESSYARTQQGTGLGLPLTRKLVELHGGRIDVESEPGWGSTFTLRFPLQGPPGDSRRADPRASTALSVVGGSSEPGATTVLVVEDDPEFRNLLRAYLVEEGHRILEAADGETAVRLAREEHPDAITLDIILPRKDGWQVLKDLRSDPGTRDIPVFVVTVTDDRELGLTLGVAGFFTKPVERHALLESVARLVPPRPRGARILAVDDEEAHRLLIRETLESAGHEVLLAADGTQAIDRARSERPDLVVLDLMMPGVTGFDVAEALRSEPETAPIPILVWTAKDLTEEDRRRLNSRVQAVRVKGSKGDLIGAIERVLAAVEGS